MGDEVNVYAFARYRLERAKEIREDSDYDEFEPTGEVTKIQIETAEELIKLVEEYINKI